MVFKETETIELKRVFSDTIEKEIKDNSLTLNKETFEENLSLRTDSGRFNVMAELLSDKNDVSIKVVKFAGKSKASGIVKRNEYGFRSI